MLIPETVDSEPRHLSAISLEAFEPIARDLCGSLSISAIRIQTGNDDLLWSYAAGASDSFQAWSKFLPENIHQHEFKISSDDGASAVATLFWNDADRPRFDVNQIDPTMPILLATLQLLLKALHARSENLALARKLVRLEERLEYKRAGLREVAGLANIGRWDLEVATQKLVWSRQTKRIHEVGDDYEPTLDDAVKFYAPEARDAIAHAVEHGTESGEGWNLELPLITAKGRRIWVRAVGRAIRVDGIVTRLLGVFQDISETVEQRIQLQSAAVSTQRALADVRSYQTALDKHAIVATTDLAGKVLTANETLCQLSGYSEKELLGKIHPILIQTAKDQSVIDDMWAKISIGESWRSELCISDKSGQALWLDTTIVPMLGHDGLPERFVAIQYDITSRKAAEESALSAQSRLAAFFKCSQDAVCLVDLSGKYLSVNPAFETIIGRPAHEVEGTGFRDFLHPDDLEVTKAAMKAVMAGKPMSGFVNRYKRNDGSVRHIEWQAIQQDSMIYASARDITQRIEQELELKSARAAAEQATLAKSAFLANVSHEIRTPLNGVLGISNALAQTELAPQQREMVELITGSGSTLQRLLNDILDLSKIEANGLEISNAPFHLALEARGACELMRLKADEKGIALLVEVDPSLECRVNGDAIRVRQIISNLTSNAIKFTHAGFVKVSVTSIVSDGDGPNISIKVTDTGIGFSEEAGSRLFGRFQQADGSISTNYGGTGLGLSICRALSELMGGNVHATSEVGKGSTFEATLYLPPILEGSSDSPVRIELADEAAQIGAGCHILVVDDNAINRKVVEVLLAPFGYSFCFAENGQEAVEFVQKQDFDVILMDHRMPVMDGIDATKAIRAWEKEILRSRIPIAMLTANTASNQIEAAYQAGSDIHISKPIQVEDLLDQIELLKSFRQSTKATKRSTGQRQARITLTG
jgi:PAS domain S-box-containing protein